VNEQANEAPKALISANKTTGAAPLLVSFKGSDSTDDNSIASYAWNFKDGSSADTADANHTFNQAGTYDVELKVTDENGLSDIENITIVVTDRPNSAPVARTSANTTLGAAPLTVQFTGSNSTDDNGIEGYSWDFKDGSAASTAINPAHIFTTAGTYVVELTVSDAEGLTHSKTITIQVTQPAVENVAPVARTSANFTAGVAPLSVQFYGNQSTDDKGITNYYWNFKDGGSATETNPTQMLLHL